MARHVERQRGRRPTRRTVTCPVNAVGRRQP